MCSVYSALKNVEANVQVVAWETSATGALEGKADEITVALLGCL